jgi:hypothetical protein
LRYEIYVLPEELIKYRVRVDLANASGNRPEVRVRTAWESVQILEHFLAITKLDEFLKIFPEAKNFENRLDADLIPYYLARFALDMKFAPYQLFAINTLFRLMRDDKVTKILKERFGFTYIDFIELTGSSDALNFHEIYNRDIFLQQQTKKLNGLSEELDAIKKTIWWRAFERLRYIRNLL